MRTPLLLLMALLAADAARAQETADRPRPSFAVLPQPATWVPFRARVERDGVAVGRFFRDAHGCTRLEIDAPDDKGRTIILEHIPSATYYVFRPSSGWTAQPMVLPTTGWAPVPMEAVDAGTATTEAGLTAYDGTVKGRTQRRAPSLNFFPLVRQLDSGVLERHRDIVVGEVAESLFEPPPGVGVTRLAAPGGIIALPMAKGGGQ